MDVAKVLKNIKLPAVYYREGKSCYYDTYRKKLIEITPEETVRQRVAALFEQCFHVPKEMLSLEVPMSYYVDGASGRADIIIHSLDEDSNTLYPIAVVECKNEEVFLTDKVVDQAIRYSDILVTRYFVITNGLEMIMAVYDENTDSYGFLDEILSYEQMVSRDYKMPEIKEEEFIRFTLDEIHNQELISEYNEEGPWIFGEDTTGKLRSFAVNFYQALLDTKHTLPCVKRRSFELIEDIGQRYMDYGNAGGGHYNGMYRSFLIKDRSGETQIVSMSIFGTDSEFRGENRRSYTSLTVSIDRFKVSHNSLQYNIDRFVRLSPDGRATFIHNGQIGGFKSADVIETVSLYGDGLNVDSSGIHIGTVYTEKILYLDDEEVSELVYNLIEYALLREETRKAHRSKG